MNNGIESPPSFLMDNPAVRGPLTTDTNLQEFQKLIEEKYGLKFENYLDFYRWSCNNYPKLWKEIWSYLGIICSKTFDEVIDDTTDFSDIPQWFRGAKLNYAENLLSYPDDNAVALIEVGEEKQRAEYVTFRELRKDVALMTSAFRKAGIKQGDAVACFISNRKDPIVALLAAASVGALFSSVHPLMGVHSVINRLQQISPKVLLTIDRFLHNKEDRNILKMLPEIVKGLPTLEYVIIIPSKQDSLSKDISFIPNSYFLADFLKIGLTPEGNIPPQKYDQLPFSHPLFVSYTSGTTGLPKGIVHSAGAALLGPLAGLSLHFNIQSSDVIAAIYWTGWVTWNIFVCAIRLGATLILYDGDPFFRSPTLYWDLVDEHQVTLSLLYPKILEELERRQFVPGKHNSLASLHTICAGSSKTKPRSYDFVYEKIKPDVFFAEVYGSTEFMTMFAGYDHSLPVRKEEMQVRALGIDVCCYNEQGESVLDERGELVVRKPFPSMPLYFLNDEQKIKYRQTFFSKFPGVWCHGDICAISSKTGGISLFGRSDETLKQRGTRCGSSEIYDSLHYIREISDSLCVTKVTREGDEVIFLFVKMKDGYPFNNGLIQKIKNVIGKELSTHHIPEVILCTTGIPYNMNGKKMEIFVKKILAGAQVNKENVSNPECLPYYFDISRMYAN